MTHNTQAQNKEINGGLQKKALNILKLNHEQKRKFLNSFDIVLSDCDGVVWMLVEPLPNTGTAIELLKGAGKKVKFISNNSMRTDAEYLHKLTAIGVKGADASDLVHPVKTITRYLNRHLPGQPVFSLCCQQMTDVFQQNGINIKTMKPQTNLRTEQLIDVVKPHDKVAAVILDLNFNLTFGELARAQQYLQMDDCRLLVGASDARVPVSNDFITIGSAGFMKILQEFTGKQPIILGKPGAQLGVDLVENFEIREPQRALFIGDNLEMDIKFGNSCGFQTLFVLTGASTLADMEQLPEHLKPDYVANGLADFIDFFEDLSAAQ